MGHGVRHGIIDVGSNAIRMRIVKIDGKRAKRLAKHRMPVRLGTCVFATGRISEDLLDRVVAACRSFQVEFDANGVVQVTAVATSATREADNRAALTARLRGELGLDLKVISGDQEAELLAVAMAARIDATSGKSVWLDLGAGSVEIVATEAGRVRSASYQLGALRLLQASHTGDPDHGPGFVDRLHEYVMRDAASIADLLGTAPTARFAATGGSLERLEKLMTKAGASVERTGIKALRLATLAEWEQRLAHLSPDQRIDQFDLQPDRADTIVPAAAVTLCVGRIAGATEVLIPRVSLIDGLIERLRAGDCQAGGSDRGKA